jgi:hypothetical protein
MATGTSDGTDTAPAVNAGVYVLVLEFPDAVRVRVGALVCRSHAMADSAGEAK